MNRSIVIAIMAAVFAGCAGGGEVARTPPPGCVPANDTLIVPGCRIGPIAIGMTNAELLRSLGPPRVSRDQGTFTINVYDSLKIRAMVQNGRVGWLSTSDARYHTAQGVRLGSSIMEATVELGEAVWKWTNKHPGNDGYTNYCFAGGVVMMAGAAWTDDAGRVRDITVTSCRR